MTINKRIEKFNIERGLIAKGFNYGTEYDMIKEELDEFTEAYLKGDTHGMIDALNDIMVVATGTICKLNYDPDITMSETLAEIESRVGVINPVTGKWQKSLTGLEYKANYTKAWNGL